MDRGSPAYACILIPVAASVSHSAHMCTPKFGVLFGMELAYVLVHRGMKVGPVRSMGQNRYMI